MARLFLAIVLAAFADFPATAEEIPLKEIWALNMPGTRDIHELEPKPDADNSLMAIIGRAINARYGRKVGKAFAVAGTGREALDAAFRVITGQPKWSLKPLRGGHEASIVFFTHYSHYYVHLARVARDGNAIRVEYELTPHHTDDLTSHIALIPLGPLPAGVYEVNIIGKSMSKKLIDKGFEEVDDERRELIVSSSFEFEVD
ncbi:MAG: hypothetical protein IT424_00705 [Pirellulales bacterium]|nr:hypothetical protein [Pirellulales bacterium]